MDFWDDPDFDKAVDAYNNKRRNRRVERGLDLLARSQSGERVVTYHRNSNITTVDDVELDQDELDQLYDNPREIPVVNEMHRGGTRIADDGYCADYSQMPIDWAHSPLGKYRMGYTDDSLRMHDLSRTTERPYDND